MTAWRSVLRVAVTLVVAALAIGLGTLAWRVYMLAPWTRDGRVRTEVVSIAPEVSGRVTNLAVVDNQLVRKGDLLFAVDQERYRLALAQAEAVAENRTHELRLREAQSARRARLNELSVSTEEKEQFAANAAVAGAALHEAQVAIGVAKLDLARTEIRSPVNGWVTNLLLRAGDYATTGRTAVSVIDADAFWVSGYFEETKLARIREGAKATIWLMGESRPLGGRVESIARGISDANAAVGGEGLANVNPTFTWVRLAQRIPVRIRLETVPEGARLAAGMTCTIELSETDIVLPEPANVGTGVPTR